MAKDTHYAKWQSIMRKLANDINKEKSLAKINRERSKKGREDGQTE